MPPISYVVSIWLHSLLFLVVFLLPTKVMIKHEKPMQISITAGSIGGNRMPSPVLGPKKQENIQHFAALKPLPALKNDLSAIPIAQQHTEKKQEESVLEAKAIPSSQQPVETLNKTIQTDLTKAEQSPTIQKTNAKSSSNTVKKEVKSVDSKAVLNALASFKKEPAVAGGGGGDGQGDGGGGLNDVYAGMVMVAVRPNWSMPTYSRDNITALVRVQVDPKGNIIACNIKRSSGRPDFDASAVNAVVRTKVLPPPPTLEQQEIIITFNSLELGKD